MTMDDSSGAPSRSKLQEFVDGVWDSSKVRIIALGAEVFFNIAAVAALILFYLAIRVAIAVGLPDVGLIYVEKIDYVAMIIVLLNSIVRFVLQAVVGSWRTV
jgi:hypothetical protein